MDGVYTLTSSEVIGHLLQPVLAGVQDHHFGIGGQALQQITDIGHLAIDEHHFLALCSRRRSLGHSLRFRGQRMSQRSCRVHHMLCGRRCRSICSRMRHIHRRCTVKHKALLQCQWAHDRGRRQRLRSIGLHGLCRHGLCQTAPEWARFAGHQSVLPV